MEENIRLGITKEKILAELVKIAYAEIGEVRNEDKINALNAISKMMGYFHPEKIDITSNGETIKAVFIPQTFMN